MQGLPDFHGLGATEASRQTFTIFTPENLVIFLLCDGLREDSMREFIEKTDEVIYIANFIAKNCKYDHQASLFVQIILQLIHLFPGILGPQSVYPLSLQKKGPLWNAP